MLQLSSWPFSPPPRIVDPVMVQNVTNYFEKQNQITEAAVPSSTKSNQKMLSSFFKTNLKGSKIIRIEIFDAEQFSSREKSVCKCDARLCVQHVVQDTSTDNFYIRVRDILKCMDNHLYTSL